MEGETSRYADTEFGERLFTIAAQGQLSMAIALGVELGLFSALAKASSGSPADADSVARMAGTKQRYTQEWLSCMACAKIVEVDSTGKVSRGCKAETGNI